MQICFPKEVVTASRNSILNTNDLWSERRYKVFFQVDVIIMYRLPMLYCYTRQNI